MRILALIAFIAVQLSVFTCGFDIHVHAADANNSHIAEHAHDKKTSHDQSLADHGCHVHASHSFTASHIKDVKHIASISTVQHYLLLESHLRNIAFLIEHPPQIIRS